MNHGVVWYRAHDDQESNVINEFKQAYDSIRMNTSDHPNCPLNAHELTAIQQKRKRANQKAKLLRFAKKLTP